MRRAVLIVTATSLAVSAATLRLSGGLDQMRSLPLLAAGAITAALAIAPTAYADVIFTLGNHPQTGEENIIFGAPETGNPIIGATNTSNTQFQFSSLTGQTLFQTAKGQAKIQSSVSTQTSALTSIDVKPVSSTIGYTDFIMNPLNGTAGTQATVTAVDNMGQHFTYDLGNGQNYLTMTTANNEFLVEIAVNTNGTGSWQQFKQPRVSGICTIGTAQGDCGQGGGGGGGVPEPWTLSILGAGLVGLGVAKWRKNTA